MCFVGAALSAAAVLPCQQLPEAWANKLHWRSIGPSTMGGRIIALAVYEAEPSTWWAATASGGLLKTTNNGTTFEHQFDRESVVSIGHVAVAQSDKSIVWVGTGEANPRNSVSYGNGVYKSTDGGRTWAHKGLAGTFQTGRIAIHPSNPDVVYVGSLGRLYGPNEDRGLYKTTDGGETWSKVLYVDDQTGVIDVDMHPTDPDTLMVATYERARDGFDTNDPAKRWGPGSGIWKTTDGGANWMRIKTGLPSCQVGRIGIDFYRSDPNVLMALVESEMISKQPEDAPYHGAQTAAADAGVKVTSVEPARRRGGRGRRRNEAEKDEEKQQKPAPTPAAKAGLRKGDVILAVGGERVNSEEQLEHACRQHKAGDEVALVCVDAAACQREPLHALGLNSAACGRVRCDGVAGNALQNAAAAIARAELVGLLGVAAASVGGAIGSIQAAKKHAGERIAFGKPLLMQDAVQRKLVESGRAASAAQQLTWHAARLSDLGEAAAEVAIEARIAAVDAMVLASDEAIQIHGGFGYTVEYHVERHYRDAATFDVLDGGSAKLRDRLAATQFC